MVGMPVWLLSQCEFEIGGGSCSGLGDETFQREDEGERKVEAPGRKTLSRRESRLTEESRRRQGEYQASCPKTGVA